MLAVGRTGHGRRNTVRAVSERRAATDAALARPLRVDPWDAASIDLPDASFDIESLPIPFPRYDDPE